MTLKSEIWVQAYIRRCFAAGLFAGVVRRGAAEAGAIYIIADRLDGTALLYGPAPGPAYADTGERRWIDAGGGPRPRPDILAVVARKRSFDPDLWVIETEDKSGQACVDLIRGEGI